MNNVAWLESDWCRTINMSPSTFNPETDEIAVRNISFVLRNYLKCNMLDYVIFYWVLHRKHLFGRVLNNISDMVIQLLIRQCYLRMKRSKRF
ncbi:hypothetical protein Bccel_0741 [Pseudobacteroides cellulosolvens ATCC 35603 = DSM 2933]|uniref:Uncharacterized protein n=1 Tax=Pseudobacteroides cellulosolvens ATCC 35603 = DSM 2933 TaxID=398512 RepID=A0A0L6JI02_9FIRM|nr:hypothetical protein [Pseudobacteroides cellulosolvens]KNY25481.1 hypothetical protein Bccel_0741 [Pseudobacteroides cellulosolvens ATCC 35603 = DSM 2933]